MTTNPRRSRSRPIVTCLDCDRDRRHHSRGLCDSCWQRHRRHDTLELYPRRSRSRDEVIDDWRFLAAEGFSRADAAERMGMTRDALDKAIARHSAADHAHEDAA